MIAVTANIIRAQRERRATVDKDRRAGLIRWPELCVAFSVAPKESLFTFPSPKDYSSQQIPASLSPSQTVHKHLSFPRENTKMSVPRQEIKQNKTFIFPKAGRKHFIATAHLISLVLPAYLTQHTDTQCSKGPFMPHWTANIESSDDQHLITYFIQVHISCEHLFSIQYKRMHLPPITTLVALRQCGPCY